MKELEDILGANNVKYNEPMSKHTSFKVGGNADIFITVDSQEKLLKVLKFVKNNKFTLNKQTWKKVNTYNENKENVSEQSMPIIVIGNGTNLLVKDGGIRGLVIKYIANNYSIVDSKNANIDEKKIHSLDLSFSKLNFEDDSYYVTVSSGLTNALLAKILLDNSLSGFEFAGGIPGTIGGAVYMNAGAYSLEMKNIVVSTKYLDLNTYEIKTIANNEHNFEYRKSIFQNLNTVILETTLKLQKGNKEEMKAKMQEYAEKRKTTQPLDKPSAGSTFKRGTDFITAKLIDESGLKGYSIGGAQVSEKHAGFIINTGNATAKDIINLINYVKEKVYEKFGKHIEEEINEIVTTYDKQIASIGFETNKLTLNGSTKKIQAHATREQITEQKDANNRRKKNK